MFSSIIILVSKSNYSEKGYTIHWNKHLRSSAVLVGAGLISYFNAFFNSFVSDDFGAIVHNPHISNIWLPLKTGSLPSFIESIVFTLGNGQPFLFHLNSVVWHVGVTLLVYILIYLLSEDRMFALITALLFAVHPVHTEAVTWISGLPYVLYTFFGLLGLVIFVLIDKEKLNRNWIVTSALSFGLAILSSEKAIVLPLLCVVYVLLFSSFKKQFFLFIPIGIVSVIASVRIFFLFQERAVTLSSASGDGVKIYNPLLQIPTAISSYLQLLLFPLNLTFYHEAFLISPTTYIIYLLITVAVIIFIIFLFFKKQWVLLFGSAIFIIGLLPTLLPVYINAIVAERYLYLPSIGLFLFIAWVLVRIKKRDQTLFKLIAAILVIFCIGLTIQRNSEWKDEDTLWPVTLKSSPTSLHAHYNMGDYYTRHGDIPAALEQYQQAFAIDANYVPVLTRLAIAYMNVGKYKNAEEILAKAKAIQPNSIEITMTYAILYINQKQYDKAIHYLEEAQKIDPTAPQIYNSLAGIYFDKGDIPRARQMLEKALSIDLNFAEAKKNLQFLNQSKPAKVQ